MKPLIKSISLVIILMSCNDEEAPKFCFECTETKTESSPSGYFNETETTTTHCNKTDADSERMIKDGTRNETSGSISINYQTTCIKQ